MESAGVKGCDGWAPLPERGCFTGIDWSAKDALRGVDPYLVWAEATRFKWRSGSTPKMLTVLIELSEGQSIRSLQEYITKGDLLIAGLYLGEDAPGQLRYFSAQVGPRFLSAVALGGALHGIVNAVELGRKSSPALGPHVSNGQPMPLSHKLRGKVLGVIDDGLAVAHSDFLDSQGRTRVAYLWRQDGHAPVAPFGYGREIDSKEINAAIASSISGGMVDESRVYAKLDLSPFGHQWPGGVAPFHGLDLSAHHGTAVTSLAARPRTLEARSDSAIGDRPTWTVSTDAGATAPIIAVQLPHATVTDTSGGTLNAHLFDGLLYILFRCDSSARIAVNISFGAHAGPHNGRSVLERAMDQLCALYQGRLALVLAAGNSYQSRTHAIMTLAQGESQTLNWVVHPDDRTESYVEIWLAGDGAGVTVNLTPPGGNSSGAIQVGSGGALTNDSGHTIGAIVFVGASSNAGPGTHILIAVAPTASLDHSDRLAPSGTWRIALTQSGSQSVTLDAYIQRDDVIVGTRSGGRQSFFEDDLYDMDAREDSASNPTLIRRYGNFNSIATGSRTLSVGGVRISSAGERAARYSPRQWNPPEISPDAARPQRPGVQNEPDRVAPSDSNPALEGVVSAGTRSGGAVRLVGTSAAAPQVTRRVLQEM